MHNRYFFALPALLIVTLWTGAVSIASADSSVAEQIANQQSLRASVESGEGKFARLNAMDKSRLLRAQEDIFAALDGKSAAAELSREDMHRIETAETEIAKLVAKLDPVTSKPKVVCSYEARIGSNRKERICKQLDAGDNGQAKQAVRRMQSR